jgi:hypothetical protein
MTARGSTQSTLTERQALELGTRVAVLRTIPGDDGGEVEELVLLISSEFIREQDLKGITRVKWFLHSIEHLDMVGRGSGGVSKSQHMLGDKVMCALLFNAAKRDSRERLYTMSETGYSTLMALAGPVLESSVSASAAVPSPTLNLDVSNKPATKQIHLTKNFRKMGDCYVGQVLGRKQTRDLRNGLNREQVDILERDLNGLKVRKHPSVH